MDQKENVTCFNSTDVMVNFKDPNGFVIKGTKKEGVSSLNLNVL